MQLLLGFWGRKLNNWGPNGVLDVFFEAVLMIFRQASMLGVSLGEFAPFALKFR